jgi:crotonobetainyl-CoA:carnitine CoA-transferase CaiB-like acyl-CoA transferase
MGPLTDIVVVEVATWGFVPSAAAVLADWGADVVKVEPVTAGDPLRELWVGGPPPSGMPPINFMVELMNRGKRSVGLDLTTEAGRSAFMALIDSADVFITNALPQVQDKLGIGVPEIRARNPRIVYARGTGWGVRGEEAGAGGYDAVSYTARGGVAYRFAGGELPVLQPPAFGDIMSGMTLAGGVAAALLQRERDGTAPVVDVSLLGTAVWNMAPDIVSAKLFEGMERQDPARGEYEDPLKGTYATADGRHLTLVLNPGQRFWPDLCARLGRTDLVHDPRFVGPTERSENRVACCAELRAAFASRTLCEWHVALAGFSGVWAPITSPAEVAADPQVSVNGYLQAVSTPLGAFHNVSSPVQFDEGPPQLGHAPGHGEHTDAVLREAGFDGGAIAQLKKIGAAR